MHIKKHYKAFAKFTKQIDKIKEMNSNKTLRSTVNKLTRKKPKDKQKIKK